MKNPEPTMPEIRHNDTVAGWYFRRFVAKYKEYDKKQKEIINNQRREINNLASQLDYYKECEPEDRDAKTLKIKNQGKLIADLTYQNAQLKEKIQRLEKQLSNGK